MEEGRAPTLQVRVRNQEKPLHPLKKLLIKVICHAQHLRILRKSLLHEKCLTNLVSQVFHLKVSEIPILREKLKHFTLFSPLLRQGVITWLMGLCRDTLIS